MGSETSPLSQLNDSFPGWLHTKWRQQLFFSVFSTCIRNNIYFAEEFEAEILIIRSQSRLQHRDYVKYHYFFKQFKYSTR